MRLPPRSSALPAALALLPLVLAACSNPDHSRAAHFERGERYLREGNLNKAQIEFRNAIQIAPGRADARVMSARVDEKLGDYRDALALYQSAVEAEPGDVPARIGLGRLYLLAGTPQQALDVITPALRRHPDDADLLTVRGAAYAGLKQQASALADAQRAVAVAPLNEDAVALLAALYQQQDQAGRAIELLSTTLARRPGSADLHHILATLYEKLGQGPLAESQLQQVIRIAAADFGPRNELAAFYIRAGRLDEAEQVLRAAMAAQPGQEPPRLSYIQFLTAHRSPAVGEQALRELIARNPDDYALQLALGGLQQQANEIDAAAATYRSVIARAGEAPQGLAARNSLAATLVSQRRFDEAAALVAQVLARNEHDAGALQLRAGIELARGTTGAAVTDLRSVLRDQPHSAPVLHALARAYLADGQTGLAEEALRSALEAVPADQATRLEFVQLLIQTRRADAATQVAAQVVERSPADWQGPYLQSLVAQSQRHTDEAIRDLERALLLKPDAMVPLQELSRLQAGAGRGAEAIARLQRRLSDHPQDAALHELLGETEVAAGDRGRAVPEFEQALRLAPAWWVPYHHLGLSQQLLGSAAAIRTFEQGVTATRMEPTLVIDLAAAYEQAGRPAEAIRTYENFTAAFPGLTFAANNLAMLLVTYKQDAASLQQARDLSARFVTSTAPDLLDTAGWVRLKSGDAATALPLLEAAAHAAPDSRSFHYHLGMAQLQAGQPQQARASLEAALAGSGHFTGRDQARAALAKLRP